MTEQDFLDSVKKFDRVAIVGPPKSGKTTIANKIKDRFVLCTDDFMGEAWEDVPDFVINALKDKKRFVVEGVQVARALRKGLDVDVVYYFPTPKKELTKGQKAMGKGVATVLSDLLKKRVLDVRIVVVQ